MGVMTGVKSAPARYFRYWDYTKGVMGLFFAPPYQVMPAVNKDLERAAFRVRHKVYCSELGYEPSNSLGIEMDEFDHHSTQMVVYSRHIEDFVGCVRLVHGRHQGMSKTLPFEEHCQGKLKTDIIRAVKESGHAYAEVSRLAIDKDFRNAKHTDGEKGIASRQSTPSILISLYLGLYSMAKKQGVKYLFAIVEPRLLRSLHRYSVPAIQIGDGVDHRGLRVPILIDVDDIERVIPTILKPLCRSISQTISSTLDAAEYVAATVPDEQGRAHAQSAISV